MTTIRSAAPLTSAAIPVATLSSARTDSTPESSAVSLAPTRSGRSSLGSVQDLASDPIASRNARAEAARAVHSALGGDPTALLAMVTLRMRDSKTTNRLADASANAATARDALADERAARATAAEAALIASWTGAIVNVSSISGFRPSARKPAYAAVKAAVEVLTISRLTEMTRAARMIKEIAARSERRGPAPSIWLTR